MTSQKVTKEGDKKNRQPRALKNKATKKGHKKGTRKKNGIKKGIQQKWKKWGPEKATNKFDIKMVKKATKKKLVSN